MATQRAGYLTHDGFVVPVAILKDVFRGQYSAFLKKLTVTHYPKMGPPISARMYKQVVRAETPCLYLPRTLINVLVGRNLLDTLHILFAPARQINVQMTIDLFDNQQIIIDHLYKTIYTKERILSGTATDILNLRAGMGKTFVAAGLISTLKLRTLYIVPKRPLAVQTVKDLQNCFYSDTAEVNPVVGLYGNRRKKDPPIDTHDVTVIVINSAMSRDTSFFSQYSLVVMDEVHMYCSTQRREIFRKSSTHAMLGMSATTDDRSDGFDIIAHKELAFDGVTHAENIPDFTYEDIVFRGKVSVIHYNGPPAFTQSLSHPSTGKLFTPYMMEQFMSDPHRMKLAIMKLRELYDWRGDNGEKHYIYVFCETRKPLKLVYDELIKSFAEVDVPELATGDDVGEFIGGIKDVEVSRLKSSARILLTTYGYSGTGVSIDKMTAIIFLTPRRAQMKQIIPRILRRGGDLSVERQIVDIIDNKTPLKYQYGDRANAYEFYQLEIEKTKISYTDL